MQPSMAPSTAVSVDIISTIAGTGADSYSGDGGAATSGALSFPYGVGLDAAGTAFAFYLFFRFRCLCFT